MLAIVENPCNREETIREVEHMLPAWEAWTQEGRRAANTPSVARLLAAVNAQNVTFWRIHRVGMLASLAGNWASRNPNRPSLAY